MNTEAQLTEARIFEMATDKAVDAAAGYIDRTGKFDLSQFSPNEFRAFIAEVGYAFHKEAEIPF